MGHFSKARRAHPSHFGHPPQIDQKGSFIFLHRSTAWLSAFCILFAVSSSVFGDLPNAMLPEGSSIFFVVSPTIPRSVLVSFPVTGAANCISQSSATALT